MPMVIGVSGPSSVATHGEKLKVENVCQYIQYFSLNCVSCLWGVSRSCQWGSIFLYLSLEYEGNSRMRNNRIPSDESFETLSLDGRYSGFASKYLCKCWDEKKVENNADIDQYKKFLELDRQARKSTMTQQYFYAVKYTFRRDILKVLWIVLAN